jgi:hypothetical protein
MPPTTDVTVHSRFEKQTGQTQVKLGGAGMGMLRPPSSCNATATLATHAHAASRRTPACDVRRAPRAHARRVCAALQSITPVQPRMYS